MIHVAELWLSNSSERQRSRGARIPMAIMLLATLVAIPSARAQTFTILYSFSSGGADGYDPDSRVIRDSAGNLYSTTPAGGAFHNCGGGGCGRGFLFEFSGEKTLPCIFFGGAGGGGAPGGVV